MRLPSSRIARDRSRATTTRERPDRDVDRTQRTGARCTWLRRRSCDSFLSRWGRASIFRLKPEARTEAKAEATTEAEAGSHDW